MERDETNTYIRGGKIPDRLPPVRRRQPVGVMAHRVTILRTFHHLN